MKPEGLRLIYLFNYLSDYVNNGDEFDVGISDSLKVKVAGNLLLAAGLWLLVSGDWFLVTGRLLLATGRHNVRVELMSKAAESRATLVWLSAVGHL